MGTKCIQVLSQLWKSYLSTLHFSVEILNQILIYISIQICQDILFIDLDLALAFFFLHVAIIIISSPAPNFPQYVKIDFK